MFLNEKDEQDVPCGECRLSKECELKRLECVAIRQWYYSGKYNNADIGRLRRSIKVL